MDAGAPALAPPLPSRLLYIPHCGQPLINWRVNACPRRFRELVTGNLRWRTEARATIQDKDSGWVLASFTKLLHNTTEVFPAKSSLSWLIRSVLGDTQELKIISDGRRASILGDQSTACHQTAHGPTKTRSGNGRKGPSWAEVKTGERKGQGTGGEAQGAGAGPGAVSRGPASTCVLRADVSGTQADRSPAGKPLRQPDLRRAQCVAVSFQDGQAIAHPAWPHGTARPFSPTRHIAQLTGGRHAQGPGEQNTPAVGRLVPIHQRPDSGL